MNVRHDSQRRIRFGIQPKLFLIVLAVLLSNILILLLMGSTVFEQLYTRNKIQELKAGAANIVGSFSGGAAGDDFVAALDAVETRNTVVHIFHRDESGEIQIDYNSRRGFGPVEPPVPPESGAPIPEPAPEEKPAGQKGDWGKFYFPHRDEQKIIKKYLEQFYASGIQQRLENERYVILDKDENRQPRPIIALYTALPDGNYLSLETPRQYIAETAELAVSACATVSVFTLMIGGVLLYFISRRIVQPVTEMQRAAGRIADLDFSARCTTRSKDELGMLAGAINEMSDSLQESIHELENANQMLRDDLHRSEQQDQMRKRFIANVSHDFKTPLTLITSYADSLRDLDDSQRELREEYCGIIRSEGDKMAHLVQSLLNLSRLESGMVQLVKMPFSINELIQEVTRRHTIFAEKKRLTVERVLPDEAIVEADYQRIEQVVVNLFENAVKYTPEGGVIRVSTECASGQCTVKLYNTGAPIPQDDMDRLFISFYRTDRSRDLQTHSYGLGLAIVRSIMELHGQPYGVRNLPGGVEFWFSLSVADLGDDIEG